VRCERLEVRQRREPEEKGREVGSVGWKWDGRRERAGRERLEVRIGDKSPWLEVVAYDTDSY
jgi:hypothetical protein